MNEQVFYLPKRAVLRNRYEVTSVIGTGGFGITYRAVDRLLECPVAVKEFFPQSWVSREAVTTYVVEFPEAREKRKLVEECLQNFRLEAAVLEAVKDVPYIARLRDKFAENGTEYLVLNMVQGPSLTTYMKEYGGRLPAQEALSLFKSTFDTLAQLHSLGVIHRDISPGNLVLSEDDHMLYLIDFGSATSFRGQKELKNKQTFHHSGLVAPEYSQQDRQGPWTDIFSLCATLVYLITGVGIAETNERKYGDHIPQLLMRSELSSRQQNALMRRLNPEISLRFPNIEQFYSELYGETLAREEFLETWPVFYHAKTYTGTKTINQDNFMVDTVFYYKGEDCEQAGTLNCSATQIHMAAVCDGVGGANHGELAAKTAIQALIHFVEAYPESVNLPDCLLEELLDQVNENILQIGIKIGRTATTLALLLWWGNRYYAMNIGDSPIFMLRKGRIRRLSTLHTQAELNMMTQKPVQRSDWNTLTQFFGKRGSAGSQMAASCYGKLEKGDVFLVCTDGVSQKIEESRLKRFLSMKGEKSVSAMFKVIERNGNSDNCTAVVLKF